MAINAVQYLKNVGKSFGYSAIDALKEYNPAIASLASGAKEFSAELYDSIQEFKGKAVGTDDEKGFLGTGKDILADARKNLFEDLKTGNWYNKQRIEEANNEMMKDMFGFDFDDDDFGLDDDWDLDFDDDSDADLAGTMVQAQKKSTDAIISSMDAVGSKAAGAAANATVRSADYVAQVNKQGNRALYSLNQRGFQQVGTGIAAINANISTLVTLGEPLTTHMQNSATFYTKSSEYHTAVLEKLDKIIKVIVPEETKSDRRKHTFADMFTADGTLDFSAYFDMIKDNVKESTDSVFGMLDMMGGVKGIAKNLTSSPMKFMTDAVVRGIMPEVMKSSMQSFNEALGSFFPAMLDRLQNNAKPGGILDLLGGFLFPKKDLKKDFDTGRYNHGVTQWTGESEMALKEVIPTYLAYITSALTGQPVTRFDYTRGKFVRRTAVKSYAMTRFADEAKRAGGKFREDSISAVKATGLSEENQKAMIEEIEQYFLTAFERADGKATDIGKQKFNYKDYGLTKESADLLRAVLRAYEETGQTRKATNFAGEVRLGRERYAQQMRDLEVNGDVTRSVYDNSEILSALNDIKDDKKATAIEKQKTLLGTDEYNHDIYFYLQGIWQHTRLSAMYAPSAGMGPVGPQVQGPPPPVGPVNIPMGKSFADITKIANDEAKAKWQREAHTEPGEGENRNERFYDRIVRNTIEQGKSEAVSAKGERTRAKANASKRLKEIEEEKNRYATLGYDTPEDLLAEEKRLKEQETGGAIGERFRGSEGVRRFGKIQDKIASIMATPTKVMTEILQSGETAMYRLIYGNENSDEDKGLFGYFFEKADGLFTKVDDHFKEKFDFSLKEWGKNMFKGFWDDTKKSGKEAFDWTKERVGNVLGFGGSKKDIKTEEQKKREEAEGITTEEEKAKKKPIEDAIEKTIDNLKGQEDEGGAARGRNVTKTGVIAVSEGEFIVPAKYNPYYDGPVRSTSYQLAQEKAAAKNYLGNYAEGGEVDDEGDDSKHPAGYWLDRNTGKWYERRANAPEDADLRWYMYDRAIRTESYQKQYGHGQAEQMENRRYDRNGNFDKGRTRRDKKIKDYEESDDVTVKGVFGTAGAKILNGLQDFFNRIFPKDPDKEVSIIDKLFSEENKKALKDANIKDELINNRGAMGVGAIVGAGASLLTGGIVGPFLGAGIGAATGLVIKSDKVQTALFGEVDSETGERAGGILSKKVSDFMTKELPGIGIGAGVGGVAGLFMGSPVMGAILGGTIGFVAKSDKVKNALFGEKDEEGNRTGGLFSKDVQKKVKKALPAMSIGAIAGMMVGPFGLVGNLAVGAGIGFLTTSDKFKNFVLGEEDENGKRHGGLVGKLGNVVSGVGKDIKGYFLGYEDKDGKKRQGILDSIQSIFKNLANQLSQGAKNMFSRLSKSIRDRVAQSIVKSAKQRMAKAASSRLVKGAKKVGSAAVNAAKLPFKATASGLERMDRNVKRRGLEKGYNVINKDGTRMIARERQNLRGELGMNNEAKKGIGRSGSNVNFDAMLAGVETEEELRELQEFYQYYYDPNKLYNKQESEASKSLTAALDAVGVDYKQAMELEEAAKGKFSRARRKAGTNTTDAILAEMGLSEDQNKEINSYLNKINEARDKRNAVAEDKEQARKDLLDKSKFSDRFKQLGIKMSDRDVYNDMELIADELAGRFGVDKKEEAKQKKKEEKEGKVQDSVIHIDEIAQKILYRLEGKDDEGNELTPEQIAEKEYTSIFYSARADENGTLVPESTRAEEMDRIAREAEEAEERAKGKRRRRKKLATVSEGEVVVDADSMTEDEQEIAEDGYAEGGLVTNKKQKRGPGFLGKIFNVVSGIYKKIVGENSKAANADNVAEGGTDKGLADDNDNVIQQNTEDGVVQLIKDKDGDMVENTSDPGTKAALEARETRNKGFASMTKMAGILGGIGGTLTGLGTKLFGDGKEKKKGIFASLLEAFTGENSFLGGIFNIFSSLFGGKLVKSAKNVASTVTSIGSKFMSTGIGGIALAAIIAAAFTGKFDGVWAKLTGGDAEDNSTTYIINSATGEKVEIALDEDGNPITNDQGQYQDINGNWVNGNLAVEGTDQDKSLSTSMLKDTGRGLLTGRANVATLGVTAGAKGIGKAVAKVTGKSNSLSTAKGSKAILSATGEIAEKVVTNAYDTIMSAFSRFCEWIPKIMANVPGLKQFAGNADNIATSLFTHVDDAVKTAAKKSADVAKKVASKVSKAMPFITAAIAIEGAIDGWSNASTILGISVEASTGQKLIAALVNAIEVTVPFLDLIPTTTLVNIFVDHIAPALGIDVSSLSEQREQADKDLEAMKLETGDDDLTLQDLNDELGNTGKYHSAKTKVADKVTSVFTNIKEQGLKTTISNAIQTRKTKRQNRKENGETLGDKITGAAENVVSSIKNADITQGYANMLKLATSGELGDLMKSQLIDTSDEDTGAMANIVNATLGTISKIQLVPLGAVCKIGVSIKNAVTNIFNKITNGFKLFKQSMEDTKELFTSDEEITWKEVFDTSKYEDEENPLNGIQTSIVFMGKLASVGVLIVRKLGRTIMKPIKKLIDKVSNGVKGITTETSAMEKLALDGKIIETATYKVSDDDENPINGFQKAIVQATKFITVPTAIVFKVGKSIKNGITTLITKVSNGVARINEETEAIHELAKAGKVAETATYTIEDDDENPIGGFQKAIVQATKIVWVPVAAVHKVGSLVKTGVNNLVTKVSSGISRIDEETDAIQALAKAGKPGEVMTYSIEDDDENPIGPIQKAIVQVSKFVYGPVALVHMVGSNLKTAIDNFTDNVSDDISDFSDATEDLQTKAEAGKPKEVFNVTYSGKNSILSPLFRGVFAMQKLMYGISAIFNGMFSSIGSFFSGLFDGSNGSGLLNKFKNWLNDDTSNSGGNSGLKDRVGGASDITKDQGDYFVSQTDNKYANIPYGNSNIGDIGCAPAAATMLINYTKPGSIDMKDAIKDARKYEEANGTSSDYFGSELDKYGLSSTYINGSTSKGQKSIKEALQAGHPAVLLGQNTNNDTKTKSPFGPNNHFVTATGMDNKGNVVINDPESDESKLYDSSILKSVSLGVATDMPETDAGNVTGLVGGTSYPDNKTTQNVWAYFKAKGYSDAATAAIMGNAYQESGIDPTRYQNGGPAAGMFQWENYKSNSGRFKELKNFASANNVEWTDLDAQLPFVDSELQSLGAFWRSPTSNFTKAGATTTSFDAWKSSSDVDMATRQFEAAFERAGKPAMDNRIAAAKYYNTNYANQSFTYDGQADTTASSSGTSSSSSDSTESYTIFDIVSAIGSALSGALSGDSSSSSSSSDSSDGTVYSGNGSVTGTSEQQQLVSLLKGIEGTLDYSMSGARNPDKGSADCSSTVNWAYKKVFGESVGDSTLGMIQNSNTKVVDQATSGMDYSSGGTNSSGPNVSNLAPGDILLFSRPTSSYSSGRPYRVGHVEMYAGNEQTIGHGGPGKGPTVKALSKDSKRYIQARRYKSLVSGAGSGLPETEWPTVNRINAQIGAGSGVKPATNTGKVLQFKKYTGGASETTDTASGDNSTIIKLLKSILEAAKNIVTNTEDISTISDNVINYVEAIEEMKTKVSSTSGTSSSTTSNSNTNGRTSTNVSPEDDPGIQDLVETLNAIAAG